MERKLESKLVYWKDFDGRKPLILRGARQVGKSWLLRSFGKKYFKHTIICNFDKEKELQELFRSKSPERILQNLELMVGYKINPAETLLLFDEIQECPDALNSLKYFYEEKREFPIVAAGSLLGVLLGQHSYPVGAVDLLELGPMDFAEYLQAVDPVLFEAYYQLPLWEAIPEIFHRKLLDAYHQYLIVGGMPECVQDWASRRDPARIVEIQRTLLKLYEGDFGKHAATVNAGKCLMVFRSIPGQLGKENEKFVYGAVREGARAKDLEDAITWIESAGLFHRIHNISKLEFPLPVFRKDDTFKLFLHDVGLMKTMAGVPNNAILLQDAYQFKGQLAENYFLEQTYGKFEVPPFYFSDQACREIDFILQVGTDIIPVEIKAGENVKAISLKNYLEKRKPRFAIRFSERAFLPKEGILDLPLYMAPRLPEYFQGTV